MPETAATMATRSFLVHEEALERAAVKTYQALMQETELTPAEYFVVCLRAAAKFLIQYDQNEWRDIVKHASELLLQHATLYKRNGRR